MTKLANLFGSRTLRLQWDPHHPDTCVIVNDHVISGRLMFNNDNYIKHLLNQGILVEEPEFVYVQIQVSQGKWCVKYQRFTHLKSHMFTIIITVMLILLI